MKGLNPVTPPGHDSDFV